ncbi:MAG: hypothetical protein OEY64_04020 [Nitrospinota bacterium]|nr:hypothetical protein [Nitrospinota bacterium]
MSIIKKDFESKALIPALPKFMVIISLLLAIFAFPSLANAESLGTLISPGDLSYLHDEVEGLTNCTKCHALRGGIPNEGCLDCHKDINERLKARKGYHTTVSDKKCIECHPDHKGTAFTLIEWDQKKFDHNATGYKLLFKHEKVDCEKCHTAKTKKGVRSFLGLQTTCFACHEKDDKHKGKLGKECETCHTEKDWKETLFNHDKTKYPLRGKHLKAKCETCHPQKDKGIFTVEKYDTCTAPGCHDTKERGFFTHGEQFKGRKCEECHTVNGWKPSEFKHEDSKYKGYKLEGKHAEVKCEKCHRADPGTKEVLFKPFDTSTCNTPNCHDTRERGGLTHGEQFKGQKCENCHTVKAWKETLFKHEDPKYKGYKLDGKHAELKCEKCHRPDPTTKQARFKPFDTKTCNSAECHDTKERGGLTHGEQFKGQRCDDCHTTKAWKEPTFKHDNPKYKGYKLEGKHAEVKCEKCHLIDPATTKPHYKPIDTKECNNKGCHDTKEKGAFTHGDQFKDKKCDDCHTAKGWKELKFQHNRDSKYSLIGKHAETKCEKCHMKKNEQTVWKPLETTCYACHKKDDKHKGEFGQKCEECHNSYNWQPESYFHDMTGFSLKYSHAQARCAECHKVKGRYDGLTGSDCTYCHTDPHFRQFGTDCGDCHSAKSWLPELFSHNNTGFRLEGRHRIAKCSDCHQNRIYRDVPVDCLQCHAKEFLDPKLTMFHSLSRTDCQDCHKVYSFVPATDHAHEIWSFNGAHRILKKECEKCHNTANWAVLWPGAEAPTDCNLCHTEDYNAAKSDNSTIGHQVANAATDCSQCHGIGSMTWEQISYRHIAMTFSNGHKPIEQDCVKCHEKTSLVLLAKFTGATMETECEYCHQPEFTAANTDIALVAHSVVDETVQCMKCHLTLGQWKPASYGHNTMTFLGPHKPIKDTCDKCHKPKSSDLLDIYLTAELATDCNICHLTEYNEAASDNSKVGHAATDAITTCASCHPTTAMTWTAIGYVHAQMTFSGKHLTAKSDCLKCHQAASVNLLAKFTGATFERICKDCHMDEYNSTTTLGHADPTNLECGVCHKTSGWLPASYGHTTMTFNGRHVPLEDQCDRCHLISSSELKFPGATLEQQCEDCHNHPAMTRKDTNFLHEHNGQPRCDPAWCADCHKVTDRNFDDGRDLHGGVCDD